SRDCSATSPSGSSSTPTPPCGEPPAAPPISLRKTRTGVRFSQGPGISPIERQPAWAAGDGRTMLDGSDNRRNSTPKSPGDQTLIVPQRAAVPGAPRPRPHATLVVIRGAEIGRGYLLRRRESILGRDEDVALRLLDERVSRRHASFEVAWDAATATRRVYVVDLDSTNGTYVNDQAVTRRELTEGDKIRVGDTVLKFIHQDELDVRFHEEIRNRIAYDQLTGLLTKESLYAAMEAELKRCGRY